MEIVIGLLIFLHLAGLVVGMGSGVAASRLGPLLASANDDQRTILFKLAKLLALNGHIGLALLWITGPLVIWLKYGGTGDFDFWFWAKIILAIVLTASVGIATSASRRMREGDMSAGLTVKRAGMVNVLVGFATILCAVFAFA